MNKRWRRMRMLLTTGLYAYLACGVIQWIIYCARNHYWQQDLHALAMHRLAEQLNRYLLVFAVCTLGILFVTLGARAAHSWFARMVLKVQIVDDRRWGALSASAVLLVFVTGLVYQFGFESAFNRTLITPPDTGTVLRSFIVTFSSSSLLTGFLLLMLVYGAGAIAFVSSATAVLARSRLFSRDEQILGRMGSAMLRNITVAGIIFLAVLNAWAWWATGTAKNNRPNVILISVDTLRADHLEIYGYGNQTAPNVATLAAAGQVFTNACSQAPWTIPSMASIHTGLYPHQHGAISYNGSIPEQVTTLAELLKNSNYATIGVVAHAFVSRSHGFAQGFDVFDQSLAKAAGLNSVTSSALTSIAIRYLRRFATQNFFLWLHYFDPHYSYVRHAEFGYADQYSGVLSPVLNAEHLNQVKDRLSVGDRQYLLNVYDEEISFTDAAIGGLLREIQDLGLKDHTVIVFTADHGEEFLERNDIGHGKKLYQELIHVPLVIAGGTAIPPHRFDEYVETRWIGRTILNLCGGQNVPFPGRDILAPLKSVKNRGRVAIFSEGSYAWGSDQRGEAVVSEGWKLIHNTDNDSYELYNLGEDPQEMRNVFAFGGEEQQKIELYLTRELRNFEGGATVRNQPAVLGEEELQRLRSLGYIK
jgi:arylsulfatase A-like enzyme